MNADGFGDTISDRLTQRRGEAVVLAGRGMGETGDFRRLMIILEISDSISGYS